MNRKKNLAVCGLNWIWIMEIPPVETEKPKRYREPLWFLIRSAVELSHPRDKFSNVNSPPKIQRWNFFHKTFLRISTCFKIVFMLGKIFNYKFSNSDYRKEFYPDDNVGDATTSGCDLVQSHQGHRRWTQGAEIKNKWDLFYLIFEKLFWFIFIFNSCPHKNVETLNFFI